MIIKVALTGHRPNRLGGYDPDNPIRTSCVAALRVLLERLRKEGLQPIVITGMALGFDQDGARLCVELGIPFHAYIPCINQEGMWPIHSQVEYKELVSKADVVLIVTPKPYSSGVMQRRNEAMVDNAHLIFAAWDGSSGGTGNCVAYARGREKPLVAYNPTTKKFSMTTGWLEKALAKEKYGDQAS